MKDISKKELKEARKSLEFDSKNPIIYTLIADLDILEATKNGGVNFDDFVSIQLIINYLIKKTKKVFIEFSN